MALIEVMRDPSSVRTGERSRKEETEKKTWGGEGKVSGMGLSIQVMSRVGGKRTDIR